MRRAPESRVSNRLPSAPGPFDRGAQGSSQVRGGRGDAGGVRPPFALDRHLGLGLLLGVLLVVGFAWGILEMSGSRPVPLMQPGRADVGANGPADVFENPNGPVAQDASMSESADAPSSTETNATQRVVLTGWQDWDWTGATRPAGSNGTWSTPESASPEDPLATQLELLYVLIDPDDPGASHVRVRYRESLADFGTQVLRIGDHLPPPWDAAELRHVREDAVVFVFDESTWASRIPEVLTASSEGGRSLGTGNGPVGGRRLRPRQAPNLPAGVTTAAPRMDRPEVARDVDANGTGASPEDPGVGPPQAGDAQGDLDERRGSDGV